jgi:ABC-2 type transport system permease protein
VTGTGTASHVTRRMKALVAVELERTWRSRTTWVLAGAMLAVAALLALGTERQPALGVGGGGVQVTTVLASVAFLRLFVMLVGIVSVTSEYQHGTIVWRCLTEPSRPALVTAKAAACALLGGLFGLAALQVALLVSLLRTGTGLAGLGLSSGDAVPLVVGSVVGAALAGVLGVGIGAAVRSQTAAVVGTLLAVLLIEPAVTAVAPGVATYLPTASAGAAVGSAAAIGWVAGLALFTVYAAAAAAAGGILSTWADI